MAHPVYLLEIGVHSGACQILVCFLTGEGSFCCCTSTSINTFMCLTYCACAYYQVNKAKRSRQCRFFFVDFSANSAVMYSFGWQFLN